ncbi:MAG: bifunctional hydroxymethylpyrimidine kinase/phosphomethylpyrimidine kinase [Candidatus Odinarchaeia archaeon]
MVLTIAGFDPSGGAGVAVDLKVFNTLNVYGGAVITAITIQNTVRVAQSYPLSHKVVGKQIDILMKDAKFKLAKIGMLPTYKIVKTVVQKAAEYNLKLIVDPLFRASSGFQLVSKKAFKALKNMLVGKAYVVTPNIREAEFLSGMKIEKVDHMKLAAEKILESGVHAVIIKGGHLKGRLIGDLFCTKTKQELYEKSKVSGELHGSGCIFSAALAAELAKSDNLYEAFLNAEKFMDQAIRQKVKVGRGRPIVPYFIG